MIPKNSPLYKELKDALVKDRLDDKFKAEAELRLATIERELETGRLAYDEIGELHKQITELRERLNWIKK